MKKLFENFSFRYLLILFFAAGMLSCTDNPADVDDNGPGEEELITKVTLTLFAEDNSQTQVSWEDPDGPGGNNPVIGTLQLQAGTIYTGTIELLDTTEDPAENITVEVREEADEHQFFYSLEDDAADRIAINITDTDEDGLPVGLEFQVEVSSGPSTSGTLNVVLSHYDDAPKDGTTRSDETDVDIDIPVEISAQ